GAAATTSSRLARTGIMRSYRRIGRSRRAELGLALAEVIRPPAARVRHARSRRLAAVGVGRACLERDRVADARLDAARGPAVEAGVHRDEAADAAIGRAVAGLIARD